MDKEILLLTSKEAEEKVRKHFYDLIHQINQNVETCNSGKLIENVGDLGKTLTNMLVSEYGGIAEINQYNRTIKHAKDNFKICLK